MYFCEKIHKKSIPFLEMKYYETHFEDYIHAVEEHNIHPELNSFYATLPLSKYKLENLILHGPVGIGKYSQVLYLLKRYSPSDLKYEKKMTIQTEKQNYIYKISDIHYEIDISLLGCNSKIVWHELFFQIIDIVSVKHDKFGIILCKNFQTIHSELLDIFYSYIQQYNHSHTNIIIKFIIISEQISFLPSAIINSCNIINVRRPDIANYEIMIQSKNNHSVQHIQEIGVEGIINLKEIHSFTRLTSINDLPNDHFNTICDAIIGEITKKEKIEFTNFRDILYDILTYNLEISETIWFILRHLIARNLLTPSNVHDILQQESLSLKYYNNNYRPIYHLESIMYYIINKIRGSDEL
jgi:hypothetical protein